MKISGGLAQGGALYRRGGPSGRLCDQSVLRLAMMRPPPPLASAIMTTRKKAFSPGRLLPLFLVLLPVTATAFTPDAEYNSQPGLAGIKAGAAYDLGITGAGIRIGIVDTGINPLHEAFASAIAAGYNFRTGSEQLDDTGINHGSHVAGVAAARRDGSGMMGVAYGADLVVAATDMSSTQLAAGITFAVSNGARIINNSWGYTGNTIASYSATSFSNLYPDLLLALQNAVASDAVVVFSNGNEGFLQPQVMGGLPVLFPELQRNWITVAASTDDAKYFSPYSNRCGVAAAWCVLAPGGYSGYDTGVNSADGSTTSGYVSRYGSSESTAMVSGALALIAERFPWLTGEQLAGVLLTTATHGTDATLSTLYGRGEVDIAKAIQGPGALEFDYDVNVTSDSVWSNNISGSGALIKHGDTGVLTLTGSNSFTGGVTLAGGTLSISSDSNLGAVTAALQLAGGGLQITSDMSSARSITMQADTESEIDTGSFRLQLTGSLHGSGLLEKNGTGILELAGSSDFSGSTHVQAGRLETSASSFSGDVVNDATLVFTQSVDGVFAGKISGNGTLIKAGAAALELSGSNDFSGVMDVQAGTLLGNAAAFSSDISNAATVVFAQTDDGEYNHVMSGNGRLVKTGSGRLLLSGSNNYSGGSEVQEGVLEGQATSLQGDFSGAGTLVFNQADTGYYSGRLLDLAAVEKKGDGVLYLQAAGNSAGLTTISAGTLVLTQGLTSDVHVQGGALVAPGGVTGDISIASGRLLAGGSAGLLRITGSLEMAQDSVLQLQLPLSGNDALVDVTGMAQLQGGHVEVTTSGAAALGRYRLLTAAEVQGGFADVAADNAAFNAFLRNEGNDVMLVLARTDDFLVERAQGRNSRAAAKSMQTVLASGFYSDVYADSVNQLATASASGSAAELASLSGEVVANAAPVFMRLLDDMIWTGFAGNNQTGRQSFAAAGRSAGGHSLALAAADENGPRAWLYGTGQRSRVDGSVDASGYGADQMLLSAGTDAALSPDLRLGAMLLQGSVSLQRDASMDASDSDIVAAGLYLRFDREAFDLASALTGGNIDTRTRRWISTAGSSTEAVADSRTRLLTADLALRYHGLERASYRLNPLLAASWTHLDTPAFSENSSSTFALSYADASQQSTSVSAGMEFVLMQETHFSCHASLLWRHDFSQEEDYTLRVSYALLPDSGFDVTPALAGRDTARLSAGLGYGFSSGLQFRLEGTAEAGQGYSAGGGTLGLNYSW